MIRRILFLTLTVGITCLLITFGTSQTEIVRNVYDGTLDDPSIASFVLVIIPMALLAKLSHDGLVYDWDKKKYVNSNGF